MNIENKSYKINIYYKMYEIIIYIILGIISGLSLGTTGINPSNFVLLILDILGIGDYKSNLGSVLFLNLFPISVGSVYEFYKQNWINYPLAFILIITAIVGSYYGSTLVTDKKKALSNKTIKYITGYFSLIIGFAFLLNAYYEK